MTTDSLGDRIKRYEAVSRYSLLPNSCVFIRVDGRAFHTFTRRCRKPFDHGLMDSMVAATVTTSRDMQGFKLAYTQSDEATFLLTDFDTPQTQPWFDNDLNKLVSLSASLFTAHFNLAYRSGEGVAAFDSRAFVVPREDAPNVFVWRQKDWERNSISMLAQAHFSPKQLHGKKRADMHEMLHGKGVNWAHLSDREKNGTFVYTDRTLGNEPMSYHDIDAYLTAQLQPEVDVA